MRLGKLRWLTGTIILSSASLAIVFLTAAHRPTFSEDEVREGIHKVVSIKLKDFKNEMRYISQLGFDVAGVDLEQGTVDLILSGNEFKSLSAAMGLNVIRTEELTLSASPDEAYTSYEELTSKLQAWAGQHPDIFSFEEVGKSLENRSIWAVKISDSVGLRESDEPTILFNSMHHAREVMTTEVAIDTIEQLLTNYGSDGQMTRWVNENEIWIVPMMNPDGNHIVWHGNTMWRKNARGGFGVDINRNYPYRWGSCGGSSGSTWSETYRGSAPGSEPETQALMSLVSRIKPVFSISYHSYSELVLFPYGCDGKRTINRDVVEGIGKQMASLLPSDSNSSRKYKPGTPWDILYEVDGGDIDWMYHEHQVIPYVIELNGSSQGFQPSYSRWRQPTVEKARAAWGLLLDRLEKSGIRGKITLADGSPAVGSQITISSRKNKELVAMTYTVAADGSYHIVVNPGSYQITIKTGEISANYDVDVAENRINLDHSF